MGIAFALEISKSSQSLCLKYISTLASQILYLFVPCALKARSFGSTANRVVFIKFTSSRCNNSIEIGDDNIFALVYLYNFSVLVVSLLLVWQQD